MKTFETTLRAGRVVKIMANSSTEAREKLQELYGRRNVPYLPKMIPH